MTVVSEATCDYDTRQTARILYEAYVGNAAEMPVQWCDLPSAARSHWCAAALKAREIRESAMLDHSVALAASVNQLQREASEHREARVALARCLDLALASIDPSSIPGVQNFLRSLREDFGLEAGGVAEG